MSYSHSLLMRRSVLGMITAVAILAALPDVALPKQDAMLGTWKFLPEKSMFAPGPAPYRSMTLNFTATEAGLRNEAKGMGADGEPIDATFEVVTDGKYHPVTPSSHSLPITVRCDY